jgi:acyl carrier protein
VQTGAEKKYTISSRSFFTEEFEIPAEKVVPEANFFADLALGRIDALDMVGMLETRLDIEVREEDLKTIRTVRDVVDYICRKAEERGKA